MSDDTQKHLLTTFKQIFRGAHNRFTIHVPPFTLNENKSKFEPSWIGWAKYGKESFKEVPAGYEPGDHVPVSVEQYKAHLNGDYGLAISPLIESVSISKGVAENVCAYGLIDIDVYGVDFLFLINRLYLDGFKFAAIMSKSGGLHLYFLFHEYEQAVEVRQLLKKIVDLYGLSRLFKDEKNGVSKVEVFPEHDVCKPGIKDKGIFLPFFNAVGNCPNKMLTAEGVATGIVNALPLIKKQFTSVKEMAACIDALPYSDAPYCVQAVLLSGALWEGSHRNDFMFTAALYLKMKHGKDALTIEMLDDMNKRLADPLEHIHLASIRNSVISNDYPLLGQCKKQPMTAFCDRAQCKERTFSAVKKDKNNVASNIEFGQIYRMLAETPYYTIEARLAGSEDAFKLLRVDAAENFLNQKTIQKECIDKLGQVMWTVKQAVWEERLNEVMLRLQEKQVPRETDTTEMSDLRELFYRYITHRQAASSTPHRIGLKQVYYADGVYYFKTDGLKEYLRVAKYALRCNLREQLLSYGCREGEISYVRKDGTIATIKCWLKEEDDALKNMTKFYDDVIDSDGDVLGQNKVEKTDARNNIGEERF